MKKRNVLTLVLALVLVAALAVGGTLAYFTSEDETENTFTMGKVEIDLDESKEQNAQGEDIWVQTGLDYQNVLPGAETTKKARITVKEGSANSYIMVTVKLTDYPVYDQATGEGFTDTDIEAIYKAIETAIGTTNWSVTKANGKLQCVYIGGTNNDGVVKAKESVTLFEKITIPKTLGNNVASKQFKIDLKAYGMQSDNNDPVNQIVWANYFDLTEPQA